MIHRTARERLIFEARDAAEDVESLKGIRGHTATLERSEGGGARIVRVWRDGAVVRWTFSLESGEARPQFYPTDVPFVPGMACEMSWDDETGLVVKWQEQLDAERAGQFRENMESFRERVEEVTGEPLKPGVKFTAEAARDALATLAFQGQEEVVTRIVGGIVEFHETAGWSLVSEPSSGPFKKVRLKHGEAERQLIATTFGVSMIILEEAGEGSDETEARGPSVPRSGLRLKFGDRQVT